ncbi:MAG: DUF2336 domain-containing protein [Geminicoccaceae bacterium]|nr:DUF2336 domain-containing protein [Geminicoccaceae bacterium]MCB9942856.1 DUF2336 domain-containing protein [Geminicoccaceae bacterium]
MMAQGAQAAQQQALQLADVEALKRDPSAEGRALIARKFGESFDSLATSRTRDLANALLSLLVGDIEKEVRKTLSETVASSHKLPAVVARKLATDDIEVAGPILAQSPVLSDSELVEIVRTNAMQYALAVAGRERVSEELSEALVDSGHQQVVVKLVGNVGAKLSNRTMKRVMDDYRDDDQVQDRLVRRPELPYELVEEMVGIIGSKIEWELVRNQRMDPGQAKAIMKAVQERTAIGLTAREHGDQKLRQRLRERYMAGDLTHEDVLKFLRDGDINSFEQSLSLMAQLEPAAVRTLAYSPDRRYLAALSAKADFPSPHYITLRMAIEMAETTVAPDGRELSYSSDSIQFLQKQYERLRLDEFKVDELINGI